MDLTYQIVRSAKRKKLTITVERDRSVIVHAPTATSDETIRRVVDTKRAWLFDKIHHAQKYQTRPHPPGKEVVEGESAPYLGRDYRIVLAETASGQVEFSRKFIIPPAHQTKRRHVLKAWYIERANEIILPRTQGHANDLGVTFRAVDIVDSRYRWGSCTVKDRIRFNWRLIKAPMYVIDYVIVHELAHLREANHTAAFWNIVRAKSPQTEKAKAWLQAHGQFLEEDI